MGNTDNFWVDEKSIPSLPILIIFVIIHLIIMMSIYFIYYICKNRIIESCKGPHPSESLQLPVDLLKSLKLSLIGLSLLTFDNLLSHLSAIIFQDKNAYFSIGSRSIFSPISFLLYIIAIGKFMEIMLKVPLHFTKKINRYLKNVQSMILLVLGANVIYIYLGADPVLLFVILFFYILISTIFYPSGPSSKLITPGNLMELLIFSGNLWVVGSTILIYLIIFFPMKLRIILNISEEEFLLFRDERFDFEWYHNQWTSQELESGNEKFVTTPDLSDNPYLIIDNNIQVIYNMPKINLSDKIISYKGFNESFVITSIRNKFNLLFIISSMTRLEKEILDIIYSDWDFNVFIDDDLIVNKFRYNFDELSFSIGMIIVIPSPWNLSKDMWILVGPKRIIPYLIEFTNIFFAYLNNISREKEIFLVIKFPIVDEQIIMQVPFIESDEFTPNLWYLIFLS